jgi:tetratricopeptide (TPR) repeat protein
MQLERAAAIRIERDKQKEVDDLLSHARLQAQQQNFRKALEVLDQVARLGAERSQVSGLREKFQAERATRRLQWLADARQLCDQKHYNNAALKLQVLLADDPSDKEAKDLSDQVQPLAAQENAAVERSQRIDGLKAEGQQLIVRNDYSAAVAKFREALALDPNNAELEQRIRDTETRAAEQQRRIRTVHLLEEGHSLLDASHYRDAMERFEEALRLEPSNPAATRLLASTKREIELRQDPLHGVDLRQIDLSTRNHRFQTPWGPIGWQTQTRGLEIFGIVPGSRAARAGLSRGDVILGLNGKQVRSIDQLGKVKSRIRQGDPIVVTILRGSTSLEVTIPPFTDQ